MLTTKYVFFLLLPNHLVPECTFLVIFGLNVSGKTKQLLKCGSVLVLFLYMSHCILTIYIYMYVSLCRFSPSAYVSSRVLLKLHLTRKRSWLSSNRIPFLPSPLCPRSHCPFVPRFITPQILGLQSHNPQKTFCTLKL